MDARLASSLLQAVQLNNGNQVSQPAVRQPRERSPFALAVVSLIASIPLTGIALANQKSGSGAALLIVWLGLAVINVAYALTLRHPPRR